MTLGFVVALIAAFATQTFGYPPFLAKARKFGAKDCTFCHVAPEGGPPWNERGQWLMAQKEKRGAEVIDVEWLADYKPGASSDKKPADDSKPAQPKPADPPAAKSDAKVDPKVFDAYVGQYETPFGTLDITKEDDHLYGQPDGRSKEELIPETETEFKIPAVSVKVKFVKDANGKVTHLMLNIEGQEIQAKKIK
jgi:hypothetical protein